MTEAEQYKYLKMIKDGNWEGVPSYYLNILSGQIPLEDGRVMMMASWERANLSSEECYILETPAKLWLRDYEKKHNI